MRIKKIRAGVISERPVADRDGNLFADKTNRTIWQFVSGVWRSIVRFASFAAAPSSPLEGDIYLNSVSKKSFIYVNGAWQPFLIGSDAILNDTTFQNANFAITGTGAINGKLQVLWRDTGSTHSIEGYSITMRSQTGISYTGQGGNSNYALQTWFDALADKGAYRIYGLNVVNLPALGGVVKGYSFGVLGFISNNSSFDMGTGASFGGSFIFDTQTEASNPFSVSLLLSNSKTPLRVRKGNAAISLPELLTFADNASALAGGLVASDVYKTATGELRIVV